MDRKHKNQRKNTPKQKTKYLALGVIAATCLCIAIITLVVKVIIDPVTSSNLPTVGRDGIAAIAAKSHYGARDAKIAETAARGEVHNYHLSSYSLPGVGDAVTCLMKYVNFRRDARVVECRSGIAHEFIEQTPGRRAGFDFVIIIEDLTLEELQWSGLNIDKVETNEALFTKLIHEQNHDLLRILSAGEEIYGEVFRSAQRIHDYLVGLYPERIGRGEYVTNITELGSVYMEFGRHLPLTTPVYLAEIQEELQKPRGPSRGHHATIFRVIQSNL